MTTHKSLIKYGLEVKYGELPRGDREQLRKKKGNELMEDDPISLTSYLDTILPPKESTHLGQIYMEFVSCTPAVTGDVLELSRDLESQMKIRGARETGICNIREELYSECLDELIRQITINCLQRGELLNHIKEQMKETINYYQKLYESAMAFAMRKVLREQKKRKRLELREITLENQIQNLTKQIEEMELVIQDKIKKDEEDNKFDNEEHEENVKQLKIENQQKANQIKEILTTPKQVASAFKK